MVFFSMVQSMLFTDINDLLGYSTTKITPLYLQFVLDVHTAQSMLEEETETYFIPGNKQN